MIDLFNGSLGKTQHTGGSRLFSTPHTLHVEPTFSVNTGIIGDFISCSLDGRLWLFKRSKRLTFCALKWNSKKNIFEFAASLALSGENFVARGLDWILTDKSFVIVLDDSPYILMDSLYSTDIQDSFLYSILRSMFVNSSGYDPFTNQFWGMRDDNGNSEGWGVFNSNTTLLYPEGSYNMQPCYTWLPQIGDFYIIDNFLIRRPIVPLPESEGIPSYNGMKLLRPLIPLEFCYGKLPAHGTGYDLDHKGIQVFAHNGKLYARGMYYIGEVSILPATFDQDGNVQEYYLFIAPDYIYGNSNIQPGDDWLMSYAFIDENETLSAFLPQSFGTFTALSDDDRILNKENKSWDDIAPDANGYITVDYVNNYPILIHDNGYKALDGSQNFEASTLRQWIDPAHNIQAASHDFIISSSDDLSLTTLPHSGFLRQSISNNTLPLTSRSFSGFRAAFNLKKDSAKRNVLEGSLFQHETSDSSISWDNVYKHAVDIKLMQSSQELPIYYFITAYYFTDETHSYYSYGTTNFFLKYDISCSVLRPPDNYSIQVDIVGERIIIKKNRLSIWISCLAGCYRLLLR